nr:methylcrotonoyl-CoA carboxylase [Armatimonadota bacterium]
MEPIRSKVNVKGEEFRRNACRYAEVAEELLERRARIRKGGPEKALKLHHERGKLTARERIEMLVDPDTPFLELGMLAAWGIYD